MSEMIIITQGQYAVSGDPDVTIATVLGSCVACCLWDRVGGLGGMNHMLLTQRQRGNMSCDALGVNAMELLINELLKLGARRDRLQAKVFGGARMVDGLSDIGSANAAFTLDFLAREGIACTAQSLGGITARQIRFWPASGIVRQKITPISVANESVPQATADAQGNGLELF